MALAATTVWEIQSGGSDTAAGGGFNPARAGAGTDYSLQTTPQYSPTDLAAGSGSTTLTSAAAGFTSAMVGNLIRITTGTNVAAGHYEITAFTNTTTVTLDRTPTSGGALSGGTGFVGGCLASPGYACSVAVSGNDGWLKAATYTITSTTNNIAAGRFTLPAASNQDEAIWSGYTTTRGDGGRATILAGGSITNVALCTGNTGARLQYCILDGASKTGINGYSSGNAIWHCLAQHCPGSGIANPALIYDCETTDCNGTNGGILMTTGFILACSSHDNAGPGFSTNGHVTIDRCLAWNNTGSTGRGFVATSTGGYFNNCLAYGNAQAGFYSSAGSNARGTAWWNCVSVNNSTHGFAASTTAVGVTLFNCAGYNNTSGNVQSGAFAENNGFITLTADPFVNAASLNFALNTTSGGGAALRAAGLPITWPGASGSMIGYLDVGPAQHADPTVTVRSNWMGFV